MKSFKRLSIDPIVVFGTLCSKCPLTDPAQASETCIARVAEEIAIVQPRMVVVMGEEALETLNDLELPLAEPIAALEGEVQRLTPTIDALYVPDIDDSLDTDDAKQRFWSAFRVLGEWYDRLPPY
jgi:uracil-DNA glycosylase